MGIFDINNFNHFFDWLFGKKKNIKSKNRYKETKPRVYTKNLFLEKNDELKRIKKINEETYDYYKSIKINDFKDYNITSKYLNLIYDGIKKIDEYYYNKNTNTINGRDEFDWDEVGDKLMLEKFEKIEFIIYTNILEVQLYLLKNEEKINNLIKNKVWISNQKHSKYKENEPKRKSISQVLRDEYDSKTLLERVEKNKYFLDDKYSIEYIFSTQKNIFYYIFNILNYQHEIVKPKVKKNTKSTVKLKKNNLSDLLETSEIDIQTKKEKIPKETEGNNDDLVKHYYYNFQLQGEGKLKDKKKDGLWKYYHINGQLRYEGNFKDDKQDGLWKSYYKNGQLKNEGIYKTDKKHGFNNIYYENGQLKNGGNFKNGKLDGLWKYYYENGMKETEGNFKNDKPHGLWKSYSEKGKLKKSWIEDGNEWDEDGNETECEE